jgi:hypothetical protein
LFVAKTSAKRSLVNLSVEEQNLAAIPFAVLERRVGRRIGKLELEGTKILPDGTEVRVMWQVQGNTELGLPTEQDLDIFVALGVLTFQNNFQKTVSFTGREIAKILSVNSVHGKFYQRLKLAMDRFIPLRFRAITSTDRQEEVKWLNVFQEASFSLDRTTGRCVGTVTWTDKIIQSMDSGFFRLLDAGRYMELDGLTAKHLYRFLAVAFEKNDLIVIDARKLSSEHLGIFNVPKYLSRLMQTLEPAFDQLIRIQVISAYHVISAEEWKIALHRHPAYMPDSRTLLQAPEGSPDLKRAYCSKLLERAGFSSQAASHYTASAETKAHFYALERAVRLLDWMRDEEVLPHVATSLIRKALDTDPIQGEGRELLDWCEIATELCRERKRGSQSLRNPAGFLMKIVKDVEGRRRFVSEDQESSYKRRFRQREEAALKQEQEAEERTLILEYERFRQAVAAQVFTDLSEEERNGRRKAKLEILKQQDRYDRMPADVREREADQLILNELGASEVPPFDKWYLRRRAQQAVLPFDTGTVIRVAG